MAICVAKLLKNHNGLEYFGKILIGNKYQAGILLLVKKSLILPIKNPTQCNPFHLAIIRFILMKTAMRR
jgi:hypothetical protein